MADNDTDDVRTDNADTQPSGKGGDIDWKAEARKWERRAKENSDAAKRLKEAEDADKSELQRFTDRVTAAEKRAEEAEKRALRMEVAQAKGLTAAQAKRLTGTSKEELEADADELLEAFGGKKDAGSNKGADTEQEDAGTALFGRPKERLVPGAAPDTEPEQNPDQLADEVYKRIRGR
jgi:hypothetical protein